MLPLSVRRLFSVEAVCAALLVLLTATMCAQVVFRYVLSAPFVWADEVIGLAFTWLTFLAAAVALKHRGHVAFTFFVDRFAAAGRRVALAAVALAVIGFLGVLVVAGARMTVLVHSQLSASLEWPMSVYYAALPIGAALMLAYEARHLAHVWRGDAA